jgi:hypothetical protein
MKKKGRHVFTKKECQLGFRNAVRAIRKRRKCTKKQAISLIFWTAGLRQAARDPWFCSYDEDYS